MHPPAHAPVHVPHQACVQARAHRRRARHPRVPRRAARRLEGAAPAVAGADHRRAALLSRRRWSGPTWRWTRGGWRPEGKVKVSELFSGLDPRSVEVLEGDTVLDVDDLDESALAFEGEGPPPPAGAGRGRCGSSRGRRGEQAKTMMRNRIRVLKAKREAARQGREVRVEPAVLKAGHHPPAGGGVPLRQQRRRVRDEVPADQERHAESWRCTRRTTTQRPSSNRWTTAAHISHSACAGS